MQAILGRHSQLEGALQFCGLSSVGIHGGDGSWLLCSCMVPIGTVFLSPRTVSDGICPVSKLVFKCPNCQGHVLVHSTKTGAEA